ncbi:MAG: RNase H family protein [Aureliella sp.]
MISQPHYLLFCDTKDLRVTPSTVDDGATTTALTRSGRWHFVLEHLSGPNLGLPARFEATDREQESTPERLALLSVVRGLEALEGPSKVTLVTTSRYVSRGLRYGLQSWRESDYRWERFGVQMPIRNADLWQRIDCAMGYHGIECRMIQSADNPRVDAEEAVEDATRTKSMAETLPALALDEERTKTASLGVTTGTQRPGLLAKNSLIETKAVRFDRSAVGKVQVRMGPRPRLKISGGELAYRLFSAGRPTVTTHSVNSSVPKTDGFLADWHQSRSGDSGSHLRPSLYSWWQLAIEWLRWWKGRLNPPQTAYLGT